MIKWAAWVALVVVALGCGRGGVAFSGEQARVAPELPQGEQRWLNGPAELGKLRDQVVIVEAWHPS